MAINPLTQGGVFAARPGPTNPDANAYVFGCHLPVASCCGCRNAPLRSAPMHGRALGKRPPASELCAQKRLPVLLASKRPVPCWCRALPCQKRSCKKVLRWSNSVNAARALIGSPWSVSAGCRLQAAARAVCHSGLRLGGASRSLVPPGRAVCAHLALSPLLLSRSSLCHSREPALPLPGSGHRRTGHTSGRRPLRHAGAGALTRQGCDIAHKTSSKNSAGHS